MLHKNGSSAKNEKTILSLDVERFSSDNGVQQHLLYFPQIVRHIFNDGIDAHLPLRAVEFLGHLSPVQTD